jgi:predicted RNase H-like nuclease
MTAPKSMEALRSFQVAGVDGCKAGWVVALVSCSIDQTDALRYPLTVEGIWVAPHFADVLLKTYNCRLVCVDIPIGLSDGPKPRACDVAARRRLGPRAGSIFPPPARPCLGAKSYREASEAQVQCAGKKLSKQSFFIMDKIRQVDELITPAMQKRVREMHPEVTFWALNGGRPAEHSKKTRAGRDERVALLAAIFPGVADVVKAASKPGKLAPDDVLDALAGAWTAAKVALNQATALPEQPEQDSKGLRMEILEPTV